jgi:hypothetical protein
MSRRRIILTLGHVPARIFRASMAQFKNTAQAGEEAASFEHHFLYHHYPINKAHNEGELREICEVYGLHWHDPGKNLGLSGGLNFLFKEIGMTADDSWIGYDPDSFPLRPGWLTALWGVLHSNEQVGAASLFCEASASEFTNRGGIPMHLGGHTVIQATQPMMATITGYKHVLFAEHGYQEPNAFYGGGEMTIFNRLYEMKKGWVWLPHYMDADSVLRNEMEDEYTEWKRLHAHGHYPHNFDQYCRERGIA